MTDKQEKLTEQRYNVAAIAEQNVFNLAEKQLVPNRTSAYLSIVADLCERVISNNLADYTIDISSMGDFGNTFYIPRGEEIHTASVLVVRKDTPKCKAGDIYVESVPDSEINKRVKSLFEILKEIESGKCVKVKRTEINPKIKFEGQYYDLECDSKKFSYESN